MLKSAASSGRRWSCYPRVAAGSTDADAAPVDPSSSTSIAHLAGSRIYYWSVSSMSMSRCQQLCWRKSAEQTHLGCFAGSRTSVATQQRSWGLSWSVGHNKASLLHYKSIQQTRNCRSTLSSLGGSEWDFAEKDHEKVTKKKKKIQTFLVEPSWSTPSSTATTAIVWCDHKVMHIAHS